MIDLNSNCCPSYESILTATLLYLYRNASRRAVTHPKAPPHPQYHRAAIVLGKYFTYPHMLLLFLLLLLLLLPPSSFSLSPLLTHITLPHFHHSCQYYPTPARQQEVQADHAHPSGPWGVRPTRAHKPRKIALYFSW